MSTAPVARRYATALLQIGVERENFDELREQLSALAGLFAASREFKNTMLNPSIKLDERKDIMRAIADKLGLDPMVRNFMLLLLDNERVRYLGDIAEEYQRLADERAGRVRARVTSAATLDMTQRLAIKKQLQALTGADEIELEVGVDPELIGGVVARVGGLVLDGSIRHQLETMRASLLTE